MLVRLNCSGHARSVGEEENWAKKNEKQGAGDSCMSCAKRTCFCCFGRRNERLIASIFLWIFFLRTQVSFQ